MKLLVSYKFEKILVVNRFWFFIFFIFIVSDLAAQESEPVNPMTNQRMGEILRSNSSEVKGNSGNWEAYVGNRTVYVITDESHNRMRIISPIIKTDKLSDKELMLLLEANFDRALDAKYSVYQDVVWATFTHPLQELTAEQFVDALHQVVNLVNNYGTSFSSMDLIFGGDDG